MSVLNPFKQHIVPTEQRSEYVLKEWSHVRPDLNPEDTLEHHMSTYAPQQQMYPFSYRILHGDTYKAYTDPYIRRAMQGTDCNSPALRLRLQVEYNAAFERYGPHHSLTKYKKLMIDNFHNRPQSDF
jgi:hypothetical protein